MSSSHQPPMEVAESILDNVGKFMVADHARLLAENQATLERSNRSDESHRDYTRRVREAQAKQVFGANWEPPMPMKSGDDPMQIFIDSPITVSQESSPRPQGTQQQVPTVSPTSTAKSNWMLPLVLAGALGTGVAIPLVIDAVKPSPTVEAPKIQFPAYDVEKWVPE